MTTRIRGAAWAMLLVFGLGVAHADHFDDQLADAVRAVADAPAVKQVSELTLDQLRALPRPLQELDAGFAVVKTDQGNWCKLLLRYARRKKAGSEDTIDLVLLDRLVTYPQDTRQAVVAERKETLLFPGFAIDLDLGQVVPAGTGEDLVFVAGEGDEKPGRLEVANGAELWLVGRAFNKPSAGPRRRVGTGAIQPEDYAGKYEVSGDGRWNGSLTLAVDEDGKVSGSYTSEQTGRTYNVRGRVGTPTNRIDFEVILPMTVQEYEGYLWTQDRNRMTGVTRMEGLPFGFEAKRVD